MGVHCTLNCWGNGFELINIRTAIKYLAKKSITFGFGYVTASICWQPIHPGLKKSRRMGLFSALAFSLAASSSVSQTILLAMLVSLQAVWLPRPRRY